MPIVATPAGRRNVMIVLLLLAVAGSIIRWLAPTESTLHDVGTLLLVLWLPAVGNLVAWLIKRLPRRKAKTSDFDANQPFAADVQAELEATGAAPALLRAFDPQEVRCIVLAGGQGFTARLSRPLAEVLGAGGRRTVPLQFLRPAVAMPLLQPGTAIHVVVGNAAVGQGRVVG